MGAEICERWDVSYSDGFNAFMGTEIGQAKSFIGRYKDTIISADRIWLIISPWWPGQGNSEELLVGFFKNNFLLKSVEEYPLPGVRVFLFENKKRYTVR